jgi:hypothetical protein
MHVFCWSLQADWMASVKQLQQLSADVTATLASLSLHTGLCQEGSSYAAVWTIVRPLLRVLLWVLPEHVPEAPTDQGQGPSTGRRGRQVVTAAASVEAVATVSEHSC